jgi:hypothetical protein
MENKPPSVEPYDSSWDEGNDAAWDRKFDEWNERDWEAWLKENLKFPFEVKRIDDDDEAYFTDIADHDAFRLGHAMKAIALAYIDDDRGMIIKVREGKKVGHVPLCDLEVTSRKGPNFWPAREYAVWFVNSR